MEKENLVYSKELEAIKKSGRFRERKIFDVRLSDFASNDYLGLSEHKKNFKKAVKMVQEYTVLSSKASMLVNGYHPIHRIFEKTIAEYNDFEEGLVVGSGFLANLSLVEALVRKGDMLFMDEVYHASGVMASGLLGDRVVFFTHNDSEDLRKKLEEYPANRQIIAIEGIYSMSGEMCKREIFDVADASEAILIVDEAHSAGVVGKKLLGVFDYYGIKINERHIKMGTLGKAYGSYGAYILASSHLISFLANRAKPVIYSTAPSVFDTALALTNIEHIQSNITKYKKKIKKRQSLIKEELGYKVDALIVPIGMPDNAHALFVQKGVMEQGYLVGAIRQPTVEKPILRVILNINEPLQKLRHLLALISLNKVQ